MSWMSRVICGWLTFDLSESLVVESKSRGGGVGVGEEEGGQSRYSSATAGWTRHTLTHTTMVLDRSHSHH